MVVPAAIYAALNAGGPGADGWGVPMATDIARLRSASWPHSANASPIGLKIFLAALAIAGRPGSGAGHCRLLYRNDPRVGADARRRRADRDRPGDAEGLPPARPLTSSWPLLVWVSVTLSNLHPTVAGILVAMMIPIRAKWEPEEFFCDGVGPPRRFARAMR